MRLEKLGIENFRGIGRFDADFADARPVVFVGENGTGKSSVLNAVALGLSYIASRLRGPVYPITKMIASSNPMPVPDRIERDDIRKGNLSAQILWTARFGEETVAWRADRNQNEDSHNLGATLEDSPWLWSALNARLVDVEESDAPLPIAVHYQTNRRVLDIPVDTPDINYNPSRINTYDESTGAASTDFASFFRWFRFREDVENETRIDSSDYRDVQLEIVRLAITSFLDNYSGFRVKRLPPRLVLVKSYSGEGTELSFTQLSDGEKLLITLVGDIARRLAIANPDSPDPLKESGVVVIDEIELHLHPRWQRMIVPSLTRTFPNIQFFISTHSPQVLSEIESAYVFLLESSSDADEGTIFTQIEHWYGLDSNRILEDFMGVPERPERIKKDLLDLFRTIDDGDLKAARAKREHLATVIAPDEPEFAKADVLMRRLEIRAK